MARHQMGEQATLANVSEGITVVTDDVFTCRHPWRVSTVQKDDVGLFVECGGDGPVGPNIDLAEKHYLDGQLDERGDYVGVFLEKK